MSSTAFINCLGLSGVCVFISGYFECEQKILLILSEIRVCPINSVANTSTLLHMDICILFPQTLQYQCTQSSTQNAHYRYPASTACSFLRL